MDRSNLTIYESFKVCAKKNLHERAVYYQGKTISYKKLLKLVDRRASLFQNSLGVKEGDVVLVAQPNIPDVLICFFALNKIGAVANFVHPLTPFNQVHAIAKKTNTKILVLFEQRIAKEVEKFRPIADKIYVTRIEDNLPIFKKFIYHFFMNNAIRKKLGKFRGDFKGFSYISKFKSPHKDVVISPFRKDKLTVLLHSGSTTGDPKTICLGDRQFTFSSDNFNSIFNIEDKYCPGKGLLSVLPSFHGFGLCTTMFYPLTHGLTCILFPKFSAKDIAKSLRKIKLNYIVGVPVIFKKLLDEPLFTNSKYLKDIKCCFCGGDALDIKLIEEFNQACASKGGNGQLHAGYGLTETLAVTVVNHAAKYKVGSIGVPIHGLEFKVADENGNPLPPNQVGELCFKGDGIMFGYFKDEEATKACLSSDGWLKSGDLGYQDEEGFIFFKSRLKRVVKVSGVAVFPSEVEELINKIPEVKGCAVISIPNEKMGASLKAIVQAEYFDEEGMREKIMDTCRKYLIRWSVPTEIEFVDNIPLTPLNKVNFKLLQEQENKKRGL